ncbi:MAG: hypothetical protein AAF550_02390 [Myxococcota bacterium]
MMQEAVVVGLGQMGAVFAHGLLRIGQSVHPVNRGSCLSELASRWEDDEAAKPSVVVLSVSEDALDDVLSSIPAAVQDRLVLLQNELLPHRWKRHQLSPTVAVVWFEKKSNTGLRQIVPTKVFGAQAGVVKKVLCSIGIEVIAQESHDGLVGALVAKNLYILTSNIAGIMVEGTVSGLLHAHRTLAEDVAAEVLALQQRRCTEALDAALALECMWEAFERDPEHRCRGRSAPERLRRALEQGAQLGVELPVLTRISQCL